MKNYNNYYTVIDDSGIDVTEQEFNEKLKDITNTKSDIGDTIDIDGLWVVKVDEFPKPIGVFALDEHTAIEYVSESKYNGTMWKDCVECVIEPWK